MKGISYLQETHAKCRGRWIERLEDKHTGKIRHVIKRIIDIYDGLVGKF